jgi:hypothetical protein
MGWLVVVWQRPTMAAMRPWSAPSSEAAPTVRLAGRSRRRLARPTLRWPGPLALLLAAAAALPAARAAIDGEALQRLQQTCPRWDDCADKAEALALAATGSQARRQGGLLTVNLASGTQRWEDQPAAGHRHRYLGELDKTGLALLAGLRSGQPMYWLIDPASGRVLEAPSLPWPSPDGRLVLVAVPERAGTGGSLTLYLRTANRWTRQYLFEAPPGLGFSFRSWRMDSAAVRLVWARRAAEGRTGCDGLTQLRDGPYGWDLVPEPPAACP